MIRLRAGLDRDQLMAYARAQMLAQMTRIAPNVDDLHLFGGVDVAQPWTRVRSLRQRACSRSLGSSA